jgi:hypothetical protein
MNLWGGEFFVDLRLIRIFCVVIDSSLLVIVLFSILNIIVNKGPYLEFTLFYKVRSADRGRVTAKYFYRPILK